MTTPLTGPLRTAVTHGGPFHADDVLAGAILLAMDPSLSIIRTRDPVAMAAASLRFDVGGAYAPGERTFDHHHANRAVRANGVPYSSAGLIWKDVGVPWLLTAIPDEDVAAALGLAFDEQVVLPVDAADNGVAGWPFDPLIPALTSETPPWDELPLKAVAGMRALHKAYQQQVRRVHVRFDGMLEGARNGVSAADAVAAFRDGVIADGVGGLDRIRASRGRALSALRRLVADLPQDGALLELPMAALPWSGLIHQVELLLTRRVDQVCFPTLEGGWMIQSVAVEHRSFASRVPFPPTWRGMSGSSLVEASGLAEAVYCHPTGYCAVFTTRTAALTAAMIAQQWASSRSFDNT